MVEALFVQVLNMSITAVVVILAILPIRFLLRKAPKLFSSFLWCIVLFRLLCPASFTSEVSVLKFTDAIDGPQEYIGRFFHTAEQPEKGSSAIAAPDSTAGTIQKETTGKDIILQEQTQGQEGFHYDKWRSLLAAAWLAGIAVMLWFSLRSTFRLRRQLVGAVRFKDNIYLADHIASPFVYGLIRAKIYLPSSLAETEREYIILHEQIHIRRRDHLFKILAFIVLVIHWFNPFVWLAFYLSEKDMEMSCDEAVIKRLGNGIRAEYSSSLLRLAAGRRAFGGTLAAFGEGDTGSRIRHVMEYKKPAAIVLIAAVIILAATVITVGSNPANGASEKDAAENRITADEAEKILKDYLINAKLCQPEDILAIREQDTGKISRLGDEDVYQFDLQANKSTDTAAEQAGVYYAVTCDGSRIYQYDPAGPNYKELTYKGDAERFWRLDPSGKNYVEFYKSREGTRSKWMQSLGFDDDYAHQMECAFIMSVTEDTIEVDVAEYIERKDTERVRELGLTEDNDMPDGYYFHNPDTDTVTWKLDENTQYLFVDWGFNLTPEGPGDVFTKDLSLFRSYLKSYDPRPGMPFFFQVEDGTVKLLVEKPFA